MSHEKGDSSLIWFLQGGRRAKRWGKGGISSEGRREGVSLRSRQGHCYMDGMVVKIDLTRKGTCKEVGGWCFSSWKEGVDGVGGGCHLHI